MRLQDTQASCGVVALYNALCALGIARGVDELATLCRVHPVNGVSTAGLLRAAGQIEGCRPAKIQVGQAQVATGLLWLALQGGRPVLCCVDRGTHWVAVVGHLGLRPVVADGADNEMVAGHDPAAFMSRWDCGGRHAFTAVRL